MKALSDHIGVSVDKKTGVTTISVTMQDPRISACLTDTVVNRLQSYIIDYRTNKARKDFHSKKSFLSVRRRSTNKLKKTMPSLPMPTRISSSRVTVPNKCDWRMK